MYCRYIFFISNLLKLTYNIIILKGGGNMLKMNNSYLSKKILSQLNIIQTSRLTLIEAPSGFGKTTSMRTYLNKEEFNEFNIYWYTSFG